MEKKFICIRCHQGCEITTTLYGLGAITDITGNSCKLGIDYVKSELSDPRRTITTTVAVTGGELPLCPVWSEKPIPKDRVMEAAAVIRPITVAAPVDINQVICENILGTGINIISSRAITKGGQ